MKFSGQSFDLVLVLVDLRLVHVELRCHCLHLIGLFLKVLLVDAQLLCDFGAGLACKKILEFDIEFFFLLDDNILLDDLFCLFYQTLLQGLDLLKHFPCVGVCAFELPPPVVVQRVLQFFTQRLYLQFLNKKVSVKLYNFISEVTYLRRLAGYNSELALQIPDFVLKKFDVLKTLTVLAFTLLKSGLQNFNLLVQQCQLVVTANQLCAKDISLILDFRVLFLLLLILLVSFAYCVLESLDAELS